LFPTLPPNVTPRNRRLLKALGRFGMRVMRWDIAGEIPDLPKFVLVVAPHTSNWDFIVALLADLAIDMDAAWMGKHTIFVGPVGRWLRGLGGIPVVRHAAHNVVSQMADEFARRERLILAITPEGTRKRVARWKTGYWHIAHQAGVPILPVGLDFARRQVVIGQPMPTSDSHEHDEAALKAFFRTITPRHPRRA
jgi:1-acyl-sn-glycerol-3-phosphate acyltransferase